MIAKCHNAKWLLAASIMAKRLSPMAIIFSEACAASIKRKNTIAQNSTYYLDNAIAAATASNSISASWIVRGFC